MTIPYIDSDFVHIYMEPSTAQCKVNFLPYPGIDSEYIYHTQGYNNTIVQKVCVVLMRWHHVHVCTLLLVR